MSNINELVEYLEKESQGQHTEFRLVIQDGGGGYIHVMNRDSTTFSFESLEKLKENDKQ